jgi:putative NADH-flavin reductase
MLVIVVGADGLVGRRLVERALRRGHGVTAVSADGWPEDQPDERLRVVRGDVLAPYSFEHALTEQQAVLFALDADAGGEDRSQGMRNVLAAMARHGATRLICLSAERREEKPRGLRTFGRRRRAEAADGDLRRMEVLVRASGLKWTIVRPARIVESHGRGRWREGPGYALPGGSQIAADDVADFMLEQLESDDNVGHAVAIAW